MSPRCDRAADFPMDTIVLNPWERTNSAGSNLEEPISPEDEKKQFKKGVRQKSSKIDSDDIVIKPDGGENLPNSTRKCSRIVKVKSEAVEGSFFSLIVVI